MSYGMMAGAVAIPIVYEDGIDSVKDGSRCQPWSVRRTDYEQSTWVGWLRIQGSSNAPVLPMGSAHGKSKLILTSPYRTGEEHEQHEPKLSP